MAICKSFVDVMWTQIPENGVNQMPWLLDLAFGEEKVCVCSHFFSVAPWLKHSPGMLESLAFPYPEEVWTKAPFVS